MEVDHGTNFSREIIGTSMFIEAVADEPTQLDSFDLDLLSPQAPHEPISNHDYEEPEPLLTGVTVDDVFGESDNEENIGTGGNNMDTDEDSLSAASHESPASIRSMTDELSDEEAALNGGKRRHKHKKDKSQAKKDKFNNPASPTLVEELESPQQESNIVLQSEIEAIKRIEQGPSEAELRRRALIEIDEDELEEKIEFLNKAGIQAIVKATGVDKQERLVKLKVLRDNLRELIDQDEKFASDVKNFIDQHLPRVFPPGSSAVENPWSYLNRDQFSDDEQEDVQDKADAAKDEDDIILLSDSDDDMDTPAPAKAVQIAPIPVVRLPAKTKPNPFDTVMVSSSGRSALLATLRQRVLVHAKENYCQTRKIRSQELAKRIEVSENCRQFLVLLKEKWDDQAQRANEERRTRYFERTDADEDEFDENEYEPGKFLTEEEKELLLRKIRGEMEDDEDDGSITTVDDDEGIAREDEEDDAGEGDEEDVEDAIDNDDAADTISVEDARADPVQILRQVFGRSKSPNVDEESDVEVAAMEEDVETSQIGDHHAKNRKMRRYGKSRHSDASVDHDDLSETEEPAAIASSSSPARQDYHQPVVEEGVVEDRPARMDSAEQDDSHSVTTMKTSKTTKSHRVRTGNAFFRAALEEEARMAKSHGRHSMVEDEAEEEEEEGMQAGLGDFGFGVVGKREDEADALKLRKGDLDHIVDDLSSDEEEDNEEARRKRIELEEQRDKELTRKVIEAVTEGHDKVKQKKGYSFDALVRGRTKDKDGGENAEQPQEELDEEELLQRGLTDRMERMKASRLYANSDSESEDSSVGSDVEEGGLEGGEEGEGDGREDPEAAQEELARQREAERARRKQMEKQFKIQRELRRLRALQGGNGPILPSAVTLPVEESSIALSENVMGNTVRAKRLSISTLRQITAKSRQQSGATGTALAPLAAAMQPPPLVRQTSSSSLGASNGPKAKTPRSSMYRGELSRMEMDQGLGMGMAVAGPSLGIFSLVTGAAGSAGNGNSSSVGMKRSFAGALLQPDSGASNLGGKRTTSLKRGLSMGGPSFVFTSESSALSRHGTTTQGGSASMHGSHVGNSSAGGDGSMGGQSLANGSLFEKLKRSHTSNK